MTKSEVCADVAVIPPIPGHEVLSYAVPSSLVTRLAEGVRVLVPLGRRQVTGIVVGLRSRGGDPRPLRDVLDVPDDVPLLTRDLLGLCRFAATYYMASLGEVLATAVLAGLRAESKRTVRLLVPAAEGLRPAEREIVRRLSSDRAASATALLRSIGASAAEALRALAVRGIVEIREEAPRAAAQARYERAFVLDRELSVEEDHELRRAPARRRVIERLREAGGRGLPLSALGGGAAGAAVRALVERGWVRIEQRERYRSGVGSTVDAARPAALTAEQRAAIEAIEEMSAAGRYQPFLLHGVTGSGKTEVYLQAAERVLARGRGVLFLVPEIALTESLVSRVLGRFGSTVALLHSALSPGERWDEWRRLARREARAIVGVRSAVFAPLPELGLVIVDEEHDGAYKQDDGLRYNARDLAIVRARDAGAAVVLGSATPSIESWANARSARYRPLALPERIEGRPLPAVELVDLRIEKPEGEPAVFAARLRDALAENLASEGQSLLFLNRRGFAHYLQCTVCGHVPECPNCSVTLTFHLRRRLLRCHHCDHHVPAPDLCPACTSPSLRDVGIGTEQVESVVRALFPSARVARMDRDTTARRGASERLLQAWRERRIDVLIGTQMVTKGHDIPGVTLVGVVAADQALFFPDFRAAERTFQMLTQVAGRAGRGDRPGRVLVQTYRPSHFAVELAVRHDFAAFAEREIRYRETLSYPPFARLVNLRLDGIDAARVEEAARTLATDLKTANASLPRQRQTRILGPAPAPLERLRGRWRWQLLVKGPEAATLQKLVRPVVEQARRRTRTVRIGIDVDPYGML